MKVKVIDRASKLVKEIPIEEYLNTQNRYTLLTQSKALFTTADAVKIKERKV